MTDTAVDFLLENLIQLMNCDNELILKIYEDKLIEKDQIKALHEELQFLKMFLENSREKRDEHPKLKTLVAKIRDVTYKVEDVIDPIICNALRQKEVVNLNMFPNVPKRFLKVLKAAITFFSQDISCLKEKYEAMKIHRRFAYIMEEFKSIKKNVMEIHEKDLYGIRDMQFGNSSHAASSKASSPVVEEETLVGFDDEKTTIIELLTEEHEKQLKVIKIIGMPGLGKTTLAMKVYNDPFIEYHFYIRGWTYVSQVYRRRDLLVDILSSAFRLDRDEICKMRDEKLGEKLYKRLKGKRYLIVMDDIWNIKAWDELKIYFPNDNNGSKIMFTSRLLAVALHGKPHHLRFLNEDESWDLLQRKAFGKENCPRDLVEIGKLIAKKCQGLPLAIVVVSGLLAKKEKTQDWWKYVAESVSSYIASDPNKYMETLALSYNHLPHHLKPCFLYFGVFPEDYEIPVKKLIWLWVAEGFIRKNEQNSLEDVAKDYLIDLIDRSLVIVSKRRSNGGVKACRVHDLLHDLCLRKAHMENFLHHISGYEHTSFFSSKHIVYTQRRISLHSDLNRSSLKRYKLCVRSFLSIGHSFYDLPKKDVSFICRAFKLLRVLNLSSVQIVFFPVEITQLYLLRYLALHVGHHEDFQLPFYNLRNLETLLIEGPKGRLLFSDDIRKMVKLRHLYTKRMIEITGVPLDDCPFVLENLQTVGKLSLSEEDEYGERWSSDGILKCFPNLRKLKCFILRHGLPKLDFLIHLETLNIDCAWNTMWLSPLGEFPSNLKSLTLSNFHLRWDNISTIGRLPNLEVLRLSCKSFEGRKWDTCDGEFRKLRFLKFQRLDIKQWNTCSDHFPILQTLVLDDCQELEEIPPGLGDIPTLEMIELRYCRRSAENSVKHIQERQQIMGNDGLKIVIHRADLIPEATDLDRADLIPEATDLDINHVNVDQILELDDAN